MGADQYLSPISGLETNQLKDGSTMPYCFAASFTICGIRHRVLSTVTYSLASNRGSGVLGIAPGMGGLNEDSALLFGGLRPVAT